MITLLFATHGGLGNQLFHLASLDKLCEKGGVGVLISPMNLGRMFDWRRRRIGLVRRAKEGCHPLVRALARRGLVTHAVERRISGGWGEVESGQLEYSGGRRGAVLFVEKAFLQSEDWVRPDFARVLRFRPETTDAVDRLASRHDIRWEQAVFVHVRRGDYLSWDVAGAGPPVLPDGYYREGLARLARRIEAPQVVFVTDDPAYVRESFRDVPRQVVVSEEPVVDLCVMSRCASGVMSASSFSWWGAMLGPQAVPPVAPEHWLGWRSRVDFPARILSKRFEILPVEDWNGRSVGSAQATGEARGRRAQW